MNELREVMRALQSLDKIYKEKQHELAKKTQYKEALRLEQIRGGIRLSIRIVERMANKKRFINYRTV